MINDIKQDAQQRMDKCIESLETAFARVRTGRANPALLDSVKVPYYGSPTPLSQVANIAVEDGRTLTVSPWERQLVPEIERAIMKADLGVNPSTTGDLIRIPMPMLTEETRKDLIKVVRAEAESGRVAVRGVRRDANSTLKELQKEKEITEDDLRRGEDVVQKVTDEYIGKIDALLTKKEADLMEI